MGRGGMGGNVRGAAQVTADAAPAPPVATRTSFRPRPLDVNKPLKIVRNTEDLDNRGDPNAGGRGVTHGHEALDADNEAVLRVKGDGGKAAAADIPIPHINVVDTYEQDYRPDFKRCISYKRSGLVPEAAPAQEFVQYDLDSDDEEWLEGFRSDTLPGDGRLPAETFELMLWKLEVVCRKETEEAFTAAGASVVERMNPAAVATTAHLSREAAFDELRARTGIRQTVLKAVYEYWCSKREIRGKPLMRAFEAPTSASDKNPFKVFRPRERANRPQTRRRRDNDLQSYDKLREVKANLERARALLDLLLRRERRKRDILQCDSDLQMLRARLHHEPKNLHHQIEEEMTSEFKAVLRRVQDSDAKLLRRDTGLGLLQRRQFVEYFDDKKRKKRKLGPKPIPVPHPPAEPLRAEWQMLFTQDLDWTAVKGCVELPREAGRCRARVGRGGRLLFQRTRAWTTELLPPKPRAPEPGAGEAGEEPAHGKEGRNKAQEDGTAPEGDGGEGEGSGGK